MMGIKPFASARKAHLRIETMHTTQEGRLGCFVDLAASTADHFYSAAVC